MTNSLFLQPRRLADLWQRRPPPDQGPPRRAQRRRPHRLAHRHRDREDGRAEDEVGQDGGQVEEEHLRAQPGEGQQGRGSGGWNGCAYQMKLEF